MKNKLALLLLLSTSLPLAFGKNAMLLVGAGGEAAGLSTSFDFSTEILGSTIPKSWNITTSFNGKHEGTEKILKDFFPNNTNTPFTKENYDSRIQFYMDQLESGELGEKDQLIIIINTHGVERKKDELTHSVFLGNDTPGTLNLDDLVRLKAKAKEKGVKLGIIDHSCYSGGSSALADDNTCVVTATTTHSVAYNNFPVYFNSNIKKGKSIEEVFLATRLQVTHAPALPSISTEQGRKIDEVFGHFLSETMPFNVYGEGKVPIRDLDNQINRNGACYNYSPETSFNDLLAQIDANSVVTKKILGYTYSTIKEIDVAPLKQAVDSYTTDKNRLAALVNYKNEDGEIRVLVKLPAPDNYTGDISYKELYKYDTLARIKESQAKLDNPMISASDKITYDRNIRYYQKVQTTIDDLSQNNPQYANYVNDMKAKEDEKEEIRKASYDKALKVSTEERKLYDYYYRKLAPKVSHDPCGQIKF